MQQYLKCLIVFAIISLCFDSSKATLFNTFNIIDPQNGYGALNCHVTVQVRVENDDPLFDFGTVNSTVLGFLSWESVITTQSLLIGNAVFSLPLSTQLLGISVYSTNNTLVPITFLFYTCKQPPTQLNLVESTLPMAKWSNYDFTFQFKLDNQMFLYYTNHLSQSVCNVIPPTSYSCKLTVQVSGFSVIGQVQINKLVPATGYTDQFVIQTGFSYTGIAIPLQNFTISPPVKPTGYLVNYVGTITPAINVTVPVGISNPFRMYLSTESKDIYLASQNGISLPPLWGNGSSMYYIYQTQPTNPIITVFQMNGSASSALYSNSFKYMYQQNTDQDAIGSSYQFAVPDYQIILSKSVISDWYIPKYSFPNQTTSPLVSYPYPFGYNRLSNETFNTVTVAMLTPNLYMVPTLTTARRNATSQYLVYNTPTVTDGIPPFLSGVSAKPITFNSTLFTLVVVDNLSGIKTIIINGVSYKAHQYLVLGDSANGTFVIEHFYSGNQPLLEIDLVDYVDNINFYYYDTILGNTNSLDLLPTIQPNSLSNLNIWQFNFIKFIPNDIDTSNGPTNVSMVFNLTQDSNGGVDFNYNPTIIIITGVENQLIEQRQIQVEARWDYTDKVYRADFQLPPHMMNGSVYYQFANTQFKSLDLVGLMGSDADLRVWSSFLDLEGPSIISFQSDSNLVGNSTVIDFTVTVYDEPNGLASGYVKFNSDKDGLPYQFQFNVANRIEGTDVNGTFKFTITIDSNPDTCVIQTIRLSEIVLVDKGGSISSTYLYKDDTLSKQGSPFYTSYQSVHTSALSICNQSFSDLVQPNITSFTVSQNAVDVGSVTNSSLKFTLQVSDYGSGISITHPPVIYLTSENNDYVSFTPTVTLTPTTNLAIFTYQAFIPYGFGFGGHYLLISVNGITDKALNVKSYTAKDLQLSSFPFMIELAQNQTQTILQSSTRLYQHANQTITIRGYCMGSDNTLTKAYVNYRDGLGFVQQPLFYVNHRVAIINVVRFVDSSIDVKIEAPQYPNSVFNQITVTRTEYYKSILNSYTAPPQPIQCPGDCSGHGNCTFNGCVCNSPYNGPSCNNIVETNIPPPVVTPTNPTVEIGLNNTSKTKSKISIYSVREINIEGEMVKEYPTPEWTLYNVTSAVTDDYIYTTNLTENPLNTQFNVTVQWFKENSIITFAGTNVTIPKETIKYTMSLGKFKFQSPLNYLQVVMQVGLSETDANDNSQCSGQSFGLGNGNVNDLQWIKLTINDKSVYGQFLRRAYLDGRNVVIKNSKLKTPTESTYSSTTAFIGINIPIFQTGVVIDPYFSHLLGGNDDNSDQQTCQEGENEKKGLSTQQIIGIIVGSVVGFIAIALLSIYLFKRKFRITKSHGTMKLVKI